MPVLPIERGQLIDSSRQVRIRLDQQMSRVFYRDDSQTSRRGSLNPTRYYRAKTIF